MNRRVEIGICCSPKDAARLPAGAYDFVEVNVQGFLVPEKEEGEFLRNIEEAGEVGKRIESANCFLPGDLKCVGPGVDDARLARYAETAFRRAREAGVKVVVFGSGAARMAPEGYPKEDAMEDVVKMLRLVGPMAEAYGVMLVVEPLNRGECNVINSLADGAAAVERCSRPNIRLLADYYHMLKEGEPAAEIVRYGHLIKHTHIAELAGRGFPGKSGEDFRPFFGALERIGYTGKLALECAWGNMETEIEGSMRYLRDLPH